MKSRSIHLEKRRYPRFAPDPLEVAFISLKTEGEFKPCRVALIADEHPYGGCGLVVRKPFSLKIGDKCRIQLGKLSPVLSELRWFKELDEDFLRLGFKFLE